jgi:hypothetical protein
MPTRDSISLHQKGREIIAERERERETERERERERQSELKYTQARIMYGFN